MHRYLARRFLQGIITLFLIATATFAILHAVPGGPFDTERNLPPAIRANIERRFGFDRTPLQQYLAYMGNLLRGDLGPALTQEGRSVNDIIRDGLPKTATLAAAAFLLALSVGVPLGIAAAVRRARLTDRALMVAAVLGVSVPSFILASILQYIFAYRLRWAPAAGWGQSPWQLALPAVALAGFHLAFVSRLVRQSMMEVLRSDFIRTARAKGGTAASVITRHALRNALIPVVTYSGPLLAGLLAGSFVVEDIFAIPGIGTALVRAINDRDHTVVMGLTVFYAASLILLNLLADLLYCLLDPRITLADPTT